MSAADEYSLDLGDEYSRPCGSPTPAAQRWFDRGMLWIHGFNHAEAGYCFGRSFAADGSCALARWGEALALGPNYNDPILDDDRAAAALTLAQEAVGLLDASEEGLGAASVAAARALPSRLGPAGSSREDQDKAYAEAMEPVYSAFGAEDADIAFLFADALMQLNPWRLWTGAEAAIRSGDFETQKPTDATTPRIIEVLEKGLALAPRHGGLCHLYIHALEMGPRSLLRGSALS